MTRTAKLVLASSASVLAAATAADASSVSTFAPGTYADFVTSYDPIANGYNWPAGTGHRWEIAPGLLGDQTELLTEVFRVNTPTSVGTGPNTINLVPGDMVFAYTIELVTAVPNTTITSLDKFSVSGIPLFGNGDDVMWHENVKGLGWVNTISDTPTSTQLTGAGGLGGFADYNWIAGDDFNLDNDQTITLLMYTGPSAIGLGRGNFSAPPGQPGGLDEIVQGNAAAPLVLIPKIPAPGAASLVALAGLASLRRRR